MDPLGVFNLSDLSTLSLQQSINYSWVFLTPALIPAEIALQGFLPW
jgi:hypothetical protein